MFSEKHYRTNIIITYKELRIKAENREELYEVAF